MLKVALTGNIASGKSFLLKLFQDMGAYTVNADQIGHRLLDQPFIKKSITQTFGSSVLTQDCIDRSKLAKLVFNDPPAIDTLERLLHPLILKEIESEAMKASAQDYPFFIAEVPLLFEKGWERFFDKTVVVMSPSDLCKKRSKLSSKDFELRQQRFMPDSIKKAKADFCLHNEGSLEELRQQGEALFNYFTN